MTDIESAYSTAVPLPTHWLTTAAVAVLLGCNRRTVDRFADDPVIPLTAHRPYGAPGERTPAMFWRPEVEALVSARLRTGAQR